MTHLTAMTAAHATGRLAGWQTALRAENKSPGTVALYADGIGVANEGEVVDPHGAT
ncbi:MAG: hypothetical protein QOG79_2361 [Mycobacterium sp.]|jgi:hypothetical protein|nr:hypothetical protein [Mycobacterium sp.]